MATIEFDQFVAQKTLEAAAARLEPVSTIFDRRDDTLVQGIGNEWSRRHFGGDFGVVRLGRMPAISLVFIQTKDGNTGGRDPAAFGGGATDKHLIYEGLSRVAADAVLAGAGSVHRDAFFSVWHPDLVALRTSLGLPRHPAQIVISRRGHLDIDALVFNVPSARVFLIAGDECVRRHETGLNAKPWVRLIPLSDDLGSAFERLRLEEGLQRISSIGGRSTATQLVDAGLVQDLYLTTTALAGGEPDTPWYSGASRPGLQEVTRKQWHESGSRVVFDHLLLARRWHESSG